MEIVLGEEMDIHKRADLELSYQFGLGYDVKRVKASMLRGEQEYTVCGFCGQTGEHEPMCPESEVTV